MFTKIKTNKLIKANWNYKTEDSKKQEKLKNNIIENGQIENIIVRELGENYEVVNGNHRLDVFNELGIKEVFCCNLGKISDKKAKKIAIQTNELKFESNIDALTQILKEISNEESIDEMLKTLPYEKDWLDYITNDQIDTNILVEALEDTPVFDMTLKNNMMNIDNENRESMYFKVGDKINELIKEEEIMDLYNSLDILKSKTKASNYIDAIILASE